MSLPALPFLPILLPILLPLLLTLLLLHSLYSLTAHLRRLSNRRTHHHRLLSSREPILSLDVSPRLSQRLSHLSARAAVALARRAGLSAETLARSACLRARFAGDACRAVADEAFLDALLRSAALDAVPVEHRPHADDAPLWGLPVSVGERVAAAPRRPRRRSRPRVTDSENSGRAGRILRDSGAGGGRGISCAPGGAGVCGGACLDDVGVSDGDGDGDGDGDRNGDANAGNGAAVYSGDAVVQRLEDAGAVVVCTSNQGTIPASPYSGCSATFGEVVNPWKSGVAAGGSCAGAAVLASVRAGWIHVGSDAGGLMRAAAAACGVCDFAPTGGLCADARFGSRATRSCITRHGDGDRRVQSQGECSSDCDHGFDREIGTPLLSRGEAGLLARTVDDIRLAMQAFGLEDDSFAETPQCREKEKAQQRKEVVVGVVRSDCFFGTPHPAMQRGLDMAAGMLAERGYRVVDFALPFADDGSDIVPLVAALLTSDEWGVFVADVQDEGSGCAMYHEHDQSDGAERNFDGEVLSGRAPSLDDGGMEDASGEDSDVSHVWTKKDGEAGGEESVITVSEDGSDKGVDWAYFSRPSPVRPASCISLKTAASSSSFAADDHSAHDSIFNEGEPPDGVGGALGNGTSSGHHGDQSERPRQSPHRVHCQHVSGGSFIHSEESNDSHDPADPHQYDRPSASPSAEPRASPNRGLRTLSPLGAFIPTISLLGALSPDLRRGLAWLLGKVFGLRRTATMLRGVNHGLGGKRTDEVLATRLELSERLSAAMSSAGVHAVIMPPAGIPAGAARRRYRHSLLPAFVYSALATVLGFPSGGVPITRVRPEESVWKEAPADGYDRRARRATKESAGCPVSCSVFAPPTHDSLCLRVMHDLEESAQFDNSPPLLEDFVSSWPGLQPGAARPGEETPLLASEPQDWTQELVGKLLQSLRRAVGARNSSYWREPGDCVYV